MMLLTDKDTQMDDLLDKMAEEIQLDKTRYDRMVSSYEAVKSWIEEDEKFFKPYKYDVYTHGSVRLLTANKPLKTDEFDLDIAVHLKVANNNFTPERIFTELKRRLEEHEKYKAILEIKSRCLRLNYSGDFHVDILPGIQESPFDENKIIVPDRKLKEWVSSNPRGYANWFMKRVNMVEESLLEKALKAEKIPVDNFKNKKPLQRAVQLIKRYRDIYFQEDDAYKSSSIILTTLSGQLYNGEASIFETIDNIVSGIQNEIITLPQRIKVLNPVNSSEDFTDKWEEDEQYYIHFKKFCAYLYTEWKELKKQNGVIEESKILKNLFGEALFTKAQTNQTLMLENMRKNKTLGINRNTGTFVASGTAFSSTIKDNTFFGE